VWSRERHSSANTRDSEDGSCKKEPKLIIAKGWKNKGEGPNFRIVNADPRDSALDRKVFKLEWGKHSIRVAGESRPN